MFSQIDILGDADPPSTVVARGELDLASAGELRRALDTLSAGKPPVLVVDLTGVTFVDSSGLGAIAGGLKSQRAHGGALEVRGAPSHVRRVFEVSGLGALLAD